MPLLMVVTEQPNAKQTQPTSTTTISPSPNDACNRAEGMNEKLLFLAKYTRPKMCG